MKRIISFALSLIMIFSMIPMGAFATTVEDETVAETVVETQSVADAAEVQEETTSPTENETERTDVTSSTEGEEAATVVLQDGVTATVTIPAGGVAYVEVDATAGDMTLTVNGNRMYYDWYVQAGVQQYAPFASGATEIALPAGMVYTLPIYNTSADSEAVLEVTASSPVVGTVDNPAWLVMGDNVATCTAGGQAYYFTWMAEQDGTLVLTMPAGDWMYAVNNLTTTVYGDTQFSDSDPVVNPAVVEVAAGDVLQIYVNTYNPADMWNNPAGELVVNAYFEAAVVNEASFEVWSKEELADILSVANEYDRLTVSIHGGTSITLDQNTTIPENVELLVMEEGTSLTVPSGVTLTVNGEASIFLNAKLVVDGSMVVNGALWVHIGATADINGQLTNYGPVHVGFAESGTMNIYGTMDAYAYLNVVDTLNVYGTLNLHETGEVGYLQAAGKTNVYGTLNAGGGVTIGNDTGDAIIYVAQGGVMNVPKTSCWFDIEATGTLSIDGTVNNYGLLQNHSGAIILNGMLEGNPVVHMDDNGASVEVWSKEDLAIALTMAEAYDHLTVSIHGTSITLDQDLVIPENVSLQVVEEGTVLTVSSGVNVTVNGEINAWHYSQIVVDGNLLVNGVLWVNEGSVADINGSLTNYGPVHVGFGGSGTLNINGTMDAYAYLNIVGTMNVEGTLNLHETGSVGYLQAAGNVNVTGTLNAGGGVTLGNEEGDTATMHIAPGGVMNIQETSQWFDVLATGVLTVDGTVNENGTYTNQGTITVNGTWNKAAASGMTQGQFQAALDEAVAEGSYWYSLTEPVTITSDMEIPCYVQLYFGGSITVAAGATLTVTDYLCVNGTGSELLIEEGAVLDNRGQIEVVNGGALTVNGTYLNNSNYTWDLVRYGGNIASTITGVDPSMYGVNYPVNSDEELLEAIDMTGYKFVYISVNSDGVALTESRTVNNELNINYSLTVKSGVTLTVAGDFYINGTLNVEDGAALVIADSSMVWCYGILNAADGATISGRENCIYYEMGYGTLTNVPKELVGAHAYVYNASDTAELAELLESSVNYNQLTIYVYNGLMLDMSFTIPANVTLSVYGGTLTVPSGWIVTNKGVIELRYSDTALLIEAGGTLNNQGKIKGEGTITNNGTLTGNNPATSGYPMTQEELLAEIEERKAEGYSYYTLTRELTLTSDLTLSSADLNNISVGQGGVLVIPNGVTLTLNGVHMSLYGDASLTIENGGTLTLRNTGMDVDNATLTVEAGGVLNSNNSLYVHIQYATVNGLSKNEYCATVFADDLDTIVDYMAAAGEYKRMSISLQNSVTLDRDLTTPSNVSLSVQYWDGSAVLTVPAGYTLTNYGEIDLYSGGELLVEAGGKVINNNEIYCSSEGTVTIYGEWEGYDVSYGGYFYGATVTTFEELKAAAEDYMEIYINGDITVTEDLEIYTYCNINNGELTVPSGVTLTMNGYTGIYGGKLTIEKGGKVVLNNSSIYLGYGEVNVASADCIVSNGYGSLVVRYSEYGDAVVTGMPKSDYAVEAVCEVEDDLRSAVKLKGYKSVTINISENITLTSNLTIPADVTVGVGYYWNGDGITTATLTVPKGITLTNNSMLAINEVGAIEVQSGGKLVNNGQFNVYGTFTNNGTLTNNGGMWHTKTVYSAEELQKVLSGSSVPNGIFANGDIILTEDIEIPKGTYIYFYQELTVPKGVTMTVNGAVYLYSEIPAVVSGKLVNNGYVSVESGSLEIEGTYSGKGTLEKCLGQSIEGVDNSKITLWVPYTDMETLKAGIAEAASGGYNYTYINPNYSIWGIEITEDITIPENTQWYFGYNGDYVTISSGVTLTNNGEIYIDDMGTMTIENGATLVNNFLFEPGNGVLNNYGTIIGAVGSGMDVATVKALYAAIEDGVSTIWVTKNMTIAKNLTIPQGVTVNVEPGVTLTLKSGCKLNIEGAVKVYGSMKVSGTVTGNRIICANSDGLIGTVTGPDGCYRTQGQLVEDITIIADSAAGVGMQVDLGAEVHPADAWDDFVFFTIVEGEEYATLIDADTLETKGIGTVKIQAASADGNCVVTKEIEIVDYSVVIEDAAITDLYGKQKLTLTASLVPGNLTDTSIVWSLGEGDEAYATLTAKGNTATITALDVTEYHQITVIASAKDGSALPASCTVDIYPLTRQITVWNGDENVANGTMTFDLNRKVPSGQQNTLVLNAVAEPSYCALTWTSSNEKIATVSDDAVVTFTGTTGTVKLTGTATDGSKVKTTVTVKVVELVQKVEILPMTFGLVGGDSFTFMAVDENDDLIGKNVLTWSLNPEDAAYATINASTGKLTTKKVQEEVEITVTAKVIGNEENAFASAVLPILPAATQVDILDADEKVVTGKTLLLNSAEGSAALDLNSAVYPEDAMDDVTWKSSNTKIATVDENGVVTAVEGKSGTVTITATAADGSKKSASVKVQVGLLAKEVIIAEHDTELVSGKSLTLKATTEPAKPTKSGVTWSIAEGAAYASISSSGKLTAKTVYAPVTVTVKATSKDGNASETTTVTILPKTAQTLNVLIGGEIVTKTTYTVDLLDENALSFDVSAYMIDTLGEKEPAEVTWKSSNAKVASVDKETGAVTIGTKVGTATITATGKNSAGKTVTAAVTIKTTKLSSSVVITEPATRNLASTKSLTLKATVSSDAANKKVVWSIVDGAEYAAISSSGKLTAAKNLTAVQTVTVVAAAQDGNAVSEPMEFKVYPLAQTVEIFADYNVTGQTLTHDMAAENTLSLSAKVYPANAIDEIEWKSSNKKIADVTQDGTVSCLKAGTVTITATAKDGSGKKATFKLTIVKKVKELSLADTFVAGGKNLTLKPSFVDPVDPTNKKVTWTMEGEGTAFATLSSSGVLKTKKVTAPKTLTVTATAADGSGISASCTVTIYPATTKVQIGVNGEAVTGTLELKVGETLDLDGICKPLNAAGEYTWKSSAVKNATVDEDGVVTGVKSGKTVTITCTAADGSGVKGTIKVKIV